MNILNKKVYVGSSKNIYKRKINHKADLKKGTHGNKHMQSAYNKDGEKVFIHSIVELCAPELLIVQESYWIKYYNSIDPKYGYNKSMPDDPEIYKKYRKTSIGNTQRKRLSKSINVCINLSTSEILKGTNLELSKITGCSKDCIYETIAYWKRIFNDPTLPSIYTRSNRGYTIVGEKQYDPLFDYINYVKPSTAKATRLRKVYIPRIPKPYSERDLKRVSILCKEISTGLEYTYKSITDCVIDKRLKRNKVDHVLSGSFGQRSHKGFHIKRIV